MELANSEWTSDLESGIAATECETNTRPISSRLNHLCRDLVAVCAARGLWRIRLGAGLGGRAPWEHKMSPPIPYQAIDELLADGEEITDCAAGLGPGAVRSWMLAVRSGSSASATTRLVAVEEVLRPESAREAARVAGAQVVSLAWAPAGGSIAYVAGQAERGPQILLSTPASPDPGHPTQRPLVVDVGSGTGAGLASWLQRQPRPLGRPPDWEVHAWEAAPSELPRLEAAVAATRRSGWDITLHPHAAWTYSGMALFRPDLGPANETSAPPPASWLRARVDWALWLLRLGNQRQPPAFSLFVPAGPGAPQTLVECSDFGMWLRDQARGSGRPIHLRLDVAGRRASLRWFA